MSDYISRLEVEHAELPRLEIHGQKKLNSLTLAIKIGA